MAAETKIQPSPGEVWRHYKGRLYDVLTVGVHEGNGQHLIGYRLHNNPGATTWYRPVSEWCQVVTMPGGGQAQRYTPVSPADVESTERLDYQDSQPAPPRCEPVQQDTETVAP